MSQEVLAKPLATLATLGILASSLALGGCATTITRTSEVPVREATALHRGSIVSVPRDGAEVPIASASATPDGGAVVVTEDGRRMDLAPDARVVVERRYRKGETVPNEGVVTVGPSVPMVVSGAAVTAAAGVLTAVMLGCAKDNASGSGWDFSGTCYVFWGPGVGVTGATGISLIVAGLLPRASVSRTVELAPIAGPTQAGASLSVRF